MAERRMISRRITRRAKFLRMPASAQALYMHLCLEADDEGVVEGFATVSQVRGCDDDLTTLADSGFITIIEPDELIAYIADWDDFNAIRKDRRKESIHHDLLKKNGLLPDDNHKSENWQPTDNQVATINRKSDNQNSKVAPPSIDKSSIDKSSIDKSSIDIAAAAACARENNIHDSKCQDADGDLGACLRLYENNIHPLTGEIEKDKLLSLYDKYHREWVCEAIKEAAEYNGRSIKYIEGILTRWEHDGFKTKKGDTYGRPQGGYGKSKKRLTPEEERAKWAKETPGWD